MNVSMSRTAVAMLLMVSGAAMAQPYGPGASDTEIELGQTVPFSGPVGVVGQASSLYFQALDPGGGINGRQVKLIVLSDGCSPPKTIEATRRL